MRAPIALASISAPPCRSRKACKSGTRLRPGWGGLERNSAARVAAPLGSSLARAAIARSRVAAGELSPARASMGAEPALPPIAARASKAPARMDSSTPSDRAISSSDFAAGSSFQMPARRIAAFPRDVPDSDVARCTRGNSLSRSAGGLRLRLAAAAARASRALTCTLEANPSGAIVWP